MKKKLLGIFVCTLLIATALPAVGTMTEKEFPARLGMGNNFLSTSNTPRNIMSSNRGGMFIQLPYPPDYPGDIWEWASEPDRQIIEDFWEIPSPICDIHWWGEYLLYEGGNWYFLDPELMRVNISFYEDDNGQPGALVSSYIDVKPSVTPTGIWYYFGDPSPSWQMYYFEYNLDPCIAMAEGWVSISSVASSDNGWLLWMTSPDGNGEFLRNESGNLVPYPYDVALVLTDGEPANPDLECDGSLSWTDVPPGSNVTGDFVIRNNGDPGSILHWNISEYPKWGSNWTIVPECGYLTTTAGWITINVKVTAPNEKNKEFKGNLTLINTFDPSNYCEIPIYLKTPKNKAFDFNFDLLEWLFERFPNAFPILRQLLGLQ